jgi:putative flavoprotein involved in K+ transport
VDVVVIGGGQVGLASAFYLRRAGLAAHSGYVALDARTRPGGAWPRMWASLRLFSPATYSSLPGWLMPAFTADEGYPPAGHVVDYLTGYEQRYELPVVRPVRVTAVRAEDDDPAGRLVATTDRGTWRARAVISATGTWDSPFVPAYPGMRDFTGRQLHTAGYDSPEEFAGERELLAELSEVADTTWVTPRPPRFLPDDVDGRVLFDVATARRRALEAGRGDTGGVRGLGDIVMVPPCGQPATAAPW